MKKFSLLIIVAFTSVTMIAQKQAKIKFKTKTVDYGEIEYDSNGVRSFEFTNTGNAPLVITRVNSSCGCTIPKKPEKPIQPGETGVIEVKYDTKRPGPIRKTITVESNAEQSTVALKIKGLVKAKDTKSVLEKTN
ncbi:DUF1573 domain-containing protein [Gangjinia marincola]|uniref:DUF1573 domain-containing protein n=1 Tax=Gangjinia marincola TaxID=578463 RepID=A0ABN1MIX1_9FLAO